MKHVVALVKWPKYQSPMLKTGSLLKVLNIPIYHKHDLLLLYIELIDL